MSGKGKKLCVVTLHHPRAYSGGAEHQIAYLLDALLPLNRYDVHYLARNTGPLSPPTAYPIAPIGYKNATLKLGYGIDAISLYRALLRVRPDVIYQRVACAYTGVCALYARHHGARFVWHIAHDSDVDGSRRLFGNNPLARSLEAMSVGYAIKGADAIVAQTEHQANLLRRTHGRLADAVIPNFHPEPAETIDKSGTATVVWIANFKRWKQPEMFVRAAAALRHLRNVRFLMVGAPATASSDRAWNARLLRTIEETPNVEYLGPQTQDEVNTLLARSHVLVNTSDQEGFPNTFIQAWMREMPVVSFVDPDGVLSREGVGIHALTEEELADGIRLLVADPNRRSEYAQRARSYASQRHSLRNAELLEKLLDKEPVDGNREVEINETAAKSNGGVPRFVD
jgi:glycosyltransferase involved in cell wall biosynthesis